MNMKSLTGSSIQAALTEARRRLGEDVVLVESTPPAEGRPARITVMTDAPLPAPPSEPAPEPGAPRFGYAPRSPEKTTGPLHENASAAAVALSAEEGVTAELSDAARRLSQHVASGDGAPHRRRAGQNRLFPSADAAPAGAARPAREELLEAQLKLLHDRLDGMERRFGGALIGSAQRWAAHPLFSMLLDKGMRPGTATKLFDALAAQGHTPDTAPADELRWALAQALRRQLQGVAAKRSSTGSLMLVGPSGAGKTSLALKLATHPDFYARRHPAILIIPPEEERAAAYQSPVGLYRSFGLPVQTVRTEDEMIRALGRAEPFGQILIDTPPLPVRPDAARPMLRRLKRLVAPLMPLQTHLVLSTTRTLGDFDADALQRLPLRPSAVALTHLDETLGWGRIAEWLLAMNLPVQFLSTGSRVPDAAVAFSPTWFVEHLMNIS